VAGALRPRFSARAAAAALPSDWQVNIHWGMCGKKARREVGAGSAAPPLVGGDSAVSTQAPKTPGTHYRCQPMEAARVREADAANLSSGRETCAVWGKGCADSMLVRVA